MGVCVYIYIYMCVCVYIYTYTYTYIYIYLYTHTRTHAQAYMCMHVHTCVHNCTQANIHRDTYYVYMHVHTDRRHCRQLKLTSCWPTPRGAVCMSVCECVPLISLDTKYACISVFVCFYILPVVQLQCSFERLYKNFAISPTFLQ